MHIAGWILIGFGILFMFLGAVFVLIGSFARRESVRGRVVGMCFNAMDYNAGGSGNLFAFAGNNPSGGARYPVVEYSVGSVPYHRACGVAINPSTITGMMHRDVDVWYDVKDPSRAFLGKSSVFKVIGIVFGPVGFFLLAAGAVMAFAL